jgi:hypothetical protein
MLLRYLPSAGAAEVRHRYCRKHEANETRKTGTNSELSCRMSVALGGLAVSVLATGLEVCGFKPSRGRWTMDFKGDKIRSIGGKVKPSVPCCRFTACKRTFHACKTCFVSKIEWPCLSHVSPASLLNGF